MPSFQINNQKHNLKCLQLNITHVCLTGPFLEEAIYKWPSLGSGKQAQFYACLGICCAQIFQGKFRLLNFLALLNTREWRWRKQVKKGLLVLAGIDFSLGHAQEANLWEITRVLLSYSPGYFLDLFLGKWLAKYHQNKMWIAIGIAPREDCRQSKSGNTLFLYFINLSPTRNRVCKQTLPERITKGNPGRVDRRRMF